MKAIKALSAAALLAASLLLAGLTSVQAKPIMVLVGNATANDTQDAVNHKFAELMTKYSHGRIDASVRNGASLGNNAQMLAALQAGSVQGMVLPAGFLSTIVRAFSMFDLPFLLPDQPAQITAFCAQSKAAVLMMKMAEQKGIHVIGLHGIGAQSLLTKFPVHAVSDLKGKKIRVIPSPARVGAFEDWGAIPRPMAFGEVYTGLQQGTIDGMDDPPDVILKMKLPEVAHYFTITNHIGFVSAIIVSKVWFDGLPKSLQRAVTRAGHDSMDFANAAYTVSQRTSLAAMRKIIHVSNMPPAQLQKMKELAENGVWKRMAANPKTGPIVKMLKQDLANFKKNH